MLRLNAGSRRRQWAGIEGVIAIVGGAPDIGEQRPDLLGDQVRGLGVPLDDAHPIDDRPAAMSPLKAVYVTASRQGHVVPRFAIGSSEEVIGLGVCLVAVDLCRVIHQVVLIPGLRRVVYERPVDEILYRAHESDVVIDRVVVISGPQKCAITSVHAPRIPLHAVEDLGIRAAMFAKNLLAGQALPFIYAPTRRSPAVDVPGEKIQDSAGENIVTVAGHHVSRAADIGELDLREAC